MRKKRLSGSVCVSYNRAIMEAYRHALGTLESGIKRKEMRKGTKTRCTWFI